MTERNDRPESTEAGTKKASASKTARKKTAATKSSTPKAGTRKASAGQSTARKAKGEKAAVQPVPASRNAFEAGAARASGERRRRSGTQLLQVPRAEEVLAVDHRLARERGQGFGRRLDNTPVDSSRSSSVLPVAR